jgi:SH3 domain-containing YSC84-like protein 1
VLEMQATNPGADPLRDVLTRYGGGELRQASAPPPPAYQPPPSSANAPTQLQPRGPVQQQSLPPPR